MIDLKKNNYSIYKDAMNYFILILIALTISITFTTNPYSKVMPWTDSDVFIEIGRLLNKGFILYRDVFDHKGPLLFLIQYIGLAIFKSNTGIWVIEVISLSIALVFFYKSLRIWTNPLNSFISVIIGCGYLSNYLSYGNYTEEYALPFIAISMYIFSKYFKDKKYELSKIQIFILGMLFGLTLMLRPNAASLWPAFCLIILINTIIKKRYKLIIKYILYFVLGMSIPILPIILYMIINNAWNDFIFSYFKFNFAYAGDANIVRKIEAFMFFAQNLSFYLSSLGFILIVCYREEIPEEKKELFISALLFQILAFICTVMSGEQYPHYAMQLVPTYLISICFLVDKVLEFVTSFKKQKVYAIYIIGLVSLLFLFIACNKEGILQDFKSKLWILQCESQEQIDNVNPIVNQIKIKTNNDDKIIVYGNNCKIYTASDRKPASKYLYQQLKSKGLPIAKEFVKDIKEKRPEVIVISKDCLDNQYGEYPYVTQEINKIIEESYVSDIETNNMIMYIKKSN